MIKLQQAKNGNLYKLRRTVVAAMQRHAEQCYPLECCGLLGGAVDLFTDYYPLANRAETPVNRFFAAPEEVFQAMRQMRAIGQQLLGIYHSHPDSRAYPSARDIELAFYPEAIYFIFSPRPTPELVAFQIERGTVNAVEYAIID